MPVTAPHPAAPPPRRKPAPARRSQGPWISLVTLLALGSAWWIGRSSGLSSASDAGYWIGVAGGVAMLALFAYPLRKRIARLKDWGSTRHWFIVHMLLGLAGPWLILVHCGFRFGSMNAAVALISMLIVALSGVVGRFLYVRVHQGLSGQRAELKQLQAVLNSAHDGLSSRLDSVPVARDRLLAFERRALSEAARASPWRSLGLWWPAHRLTRRVRADIETVLKAEASRPPSQRHRLREHWRLQARLHIAQVLRVAQFSAFERLFSLWHVLHVPFVWVMVICAVAHVVAVHAY
jgi:hypothetical protein